MAMEFCCLSLRLGALSESAGISDSSSSEMELASDSDDAPGSSAVADSIDDDSLKLEEELLATDALEQPANVATRAIAAQTVIAHFAFLMSIARSSLDCVCTFSLYPSTKPDGPHVARYQ